MAKKAKKEGKRGSIAIYGTGATGSGYIAFVSGDTSGRDGAPKLYGDGEPKADRGATSAMWEALRVLRDAGADGMIEVTIDTAAGPRRAEIEPGTSPYFGDLKWLPGRVYTISAKDIEAAAE